MPRPPPVGAVALRDAEARDYLYANIDAIAPVDSELDEFLRSSTTTAHTAITEELRTWLLERLLD